MDGYQFYSDGSSNTRRIRRVDDGTITDIKTDNNSGVSTGWTSGSVRFLDDNDGTIELTVGDTTLSTTDDTYSNLHLGFVSLRSVYFDGISFAEI